MAEIRVTSAELRARKEELEQLNQKFTEAVSRLENTVHTLDSSWEGESHDAFYSAFQKDKGQMGVFAETVRNYATVLEAIIGRYEATEQASASIATGRRY